MGHRNYFDSLGGFSVDQAVWELAKDIASGPSLEQRPELRQLSYNSETSVNFPQEGLG